jgi:hypothetical protein
MLRDIPLAFARRGTRSGDVIRRHWMVCFSFSEISERARFRFPSWERRMFRTTRDDTRIKTIEARYGIDLHARGDAKLGNLLEQRGFESLTQLVKAYRGELTITPASDGFILAFILRILLKSTDFDSWRERRIWKSISTTEACEKR